MCPTPPSVSPSSAPHHFEFDGSASAAPERTSVEVSRVVPGVSETTTRSILHIGDNAIIVRHVTQSALYPIPIDRLVFTATTSRASIFVTKGDQDTLVIDLNHERYQIKPASVKQIIEIHTGHEDDTVYVVDSFKNPFHIETGAGNDSVVSNAEETTVITGQGNDMVMTGAGNAYVNTGDGNDIVNANGSGTTVAYTGKGADFIRAGTGRAFIDAGEGNDVAVGGQGHTVLWGNEGEDLLTAGSGSNVIYAGKGQDILDGVKGSDKIFTGSDPAFITDGKIDHGKTMSPPSSRPNPNIIKVSSTPLSESGFVVLGSESFIERVQDDLRLLLSSDAGHRLISELTKSIRKSKKPITIAELKHVKNGLYIPNIGDGRSFIQVGKSGIPDFGGTVYYNPTFSSKDSLPIAALYHELCHAYNHVTGTRFLGASPDGPAGVKQAPLINNIELQAVGLPCNVEPFDFDGDPTTPASKTNPKPYSENGIREELGLPLRTTYIYYSDV